jgi:hypothetical protein
MKLIVEFLGLARTLSQTKESLVTLDDRATFHDALAVIAERFPALVGPVLTPDPWALAPSFMLNADGRRIVHDLDAPAADGLRLIIMYLEAGG